MAVILYKYVFRYEFLYNYESPYNLKKNEESHAYISEKNCFLGQ